MIKIFFAHFTPSTHTNRATRSSRILRFDYNIILTGSDEFSLRPSSVSSTAMIVILVAMARLSRNLVVQSAHRISLTRTRSLCQLFAHRIIDHCTAKTNIAHRHTKGSTNTLRTLSLRCNELVFHLNHHTQVTGSQKRQHTRSLAWLCAILFSSAFVSAFVSAANCLVSGELWCECARALCIYWGELIVCRCHADADKHVDWIGSSEAIRGTVCPGNDIKRWAMAKKSGVQQLQTEINTGDDLLKFLERDGLIGNPHCSAKLCPGLGFPRLLTLELPSFAFYFASRSSFSFFFVNVFLISHFARSRFPRAFLISIQI